MAPSSFPSLFTLSLPLAALLLSCVAPEPRMSVATSVPRTEPPAREAASAPALDSAPLSLELVDDFNPQRTVPTDVPSARWDEALGGLSGLYYDRPSATLYAISDVQPRFAPRLYTFDVARTESTLHVSPKAVLFLHESSAFGVLEDLDAESITGDGRGSFYLGTECSLERPLAQRALAHGDRRGAPPPGW